MTTYRIYMRSGAVHLIDAWHLGGAIGRALKWWPRDEPVRAAYDGDGPDPNLSIDAMWDGALAFGRKTLEKFGDDWPAKEPTP